MKRFKLQAVISTVVDETLYKSYLLAINNGEATEAAKEDEITDNNKIKRTYFNYILKN